MRKFDLDTWEEILITIIRNKTRSLLTAFGVFWGIFMLVALMGGAQGMQEKMMQNFDGFATNSGFIGAQRTSKSYKGFQQGRSWTLTTDDIDRLKNSVSGIEIITPTQGRWGLNIIFEEKSISGTLKGQYPEYDEIEEPRITLGRTLNETDLKDRRKVCVIGRRIYEALFPNKENPCGKFIKIDGIYYNVVGVNETTSNISINGQAETSVVIPFTTMQQAYNLGKDVNVLGYTVKRGYTALEVEKQITNQLKRMHSIHPDDDQAVLYVNAQAIFSMMDNLFSGISLLSWLVGIGTLLAGAIGVSNIMMVTVKERTTEIGIRRAIGARPSDILQQILSESLVLTIISGLAGISFAVFLLDMVEKSVSDPQAPVHFQISFWQAIGSCILLLILGLCAGLAPAFRAMAIKPIDAMRDE